MKQRRFLSIICILLLTAFSVSATSLGEKKRHVEWSTNLPISVSNTAFGLADIFQETVVIDLAKIARELPDKGLVFDFRMNPDFMFGLNIGNLSFHSHLGLDTYGAFGLSKDLFTFLAAGNGESETMEFGATAELEAFVFTGVSFGMNMGKLKFEVNPQVFVPAFHIAPNALTATITNGEDGSFSARATADVDVFSIINIQYFFDNSKSLGLEKIINSIGFDIGGTAEYQLFQFLKLGGHINMPIVPGTLNNRVNMVYWAEAKTTEGSTIVDVIMDLAKGGSEDPKYSYDFGSEPGTFYTDAGFKINRPFRTGVSAVYSPFGKWFNVQGMIGLGVKQPFTEYAKPYLEYSVGLNLNWCKVFELTVSSSCIKEIYSQNLDFIMNLWLFEMDLGVSLSSSSFVSSWCGRGINAYVAFTIGV